MLILKAYKFRLVPTKDQANKIDRTLGCCRFVYNRMLNIRQKAYEQDGKSMSYIDMQNMLPSMKKDLSWLAEVDSQALKYACRCLDGAYKGFFKKKNGFPRFRSKHNNRQSYTTTNPLGIKVSNSHIQLPTLGKVKYRNSRPVDGNIRKATVSKTPTGKYSVSILCEIETEPLPMIEKSVGLDVGIKVFATDSDGRVYSNPKHGIRLAKKLAREQRRLSRKTKGSNNCKKQRKKVAQVHERVTNARADTLHKLSTTDGN